MASHSTSADSACKMAGHSARADSVCQMASPQVLILHVKCSLSNNWSLFYLIKKKEKRKPRIEIRK
jgi:hypothetical protein